jgi:hypothetical protein
LPEQPKRYILAKGHCGTCQSPVSVEVEEPAPLVQTKTEPCRCGRTEAERVVRWVIFGLVGLFLCLTGSCITNQYFNTEAIKHVKGRYEVKEDTSPGPEIKPKYEIVPGPEKK